MLLLMILEPSNAYKKEEKVTRTFGIDNRCMWFFTGWCYQFHLTMSFFREYFPLIIFIEFLSSLETSKSSHADMLYFEIQLASLLLCYMNLVHFSVNCSEGFLECLSVGVLTGFYADFFLLKEPCIHLLLSVILYRITVNQPLKIT